MSSQADEDFAKLSGLVDVVKLENVRYTKLAAVYDPIEEPSQGIDLQMAFQRPDPAEGSERLVFHYRFGTGIEHDEGKVDVEVVGTYSVPVEHSSLLDDRRLMMGFGNDVALFALVPYARQAIANLALQVLYAQVNIPILKRGEVVFDISEESPGVAESPTPPASEM